MQTARRDAERPRDAPGGARRVRGGARPRSTATPRFAVRLRALLHRAARPAGRALRRRPALRRGLAGAAARDRLGGAAPGARAARRSTTSARSRPTGSSASRRSATSTYVDRFAGTLAGVRERLPYLRELGVTYLHLMPLLRARPAPNDGGYAVARLRRGRAGAGDDGRPARAGRRPARAGMALCVDLVLNHTAAEHPWTRAARLLPHVPRPHGARRLRAHAARGLPRHRARQLHAATSDRWVWTTFNAYQWDLDYTNPEVFVAMAEAMLELAAVGVDVLRLDAAPFLWKRLGTNCQNQPEVHELLQAFRAALRIAAPGGRVQGRGDRRAARPRPLPRDRPPRGQGVRPRLPQRAHGAAVERAGLGPRGADDQHAAGDAAGAARRGLGHLRALPRRHRLGDHRGGRGAGRRGRATCTAASSPTSTPATSPARSRAARASSPTRARARRAPAGTCRVAGRAGERA